MKPRLFYGFVLILGLLIILGGVVSAQGPQPSPGADPAGLTSVSGGCTNDAGYDPGCDVDHDGDSDIVDLQLVALHWGASGTWASDNWLLTGNSGTDPATNFLGTSDNQPLVLRTNGTEQARLDTAGNLGLGTDAPTQRLTVQGNALIKGEDNPVARDYDSTNLDDPQSVYVSGKYAYVASSNNDRLAIFDVSDPNNIVARGFTSTNLDNPYSVYVSGKYAYVASYNNSRLAIFEVNHLEAPTVQTGNLQTGYLDVTDNAIVGNNLHVQGGLNVGPGGALMGGDLSVQGGVDATSTSASSYGGFFQNSAAGGAGLYARGGDAAAADLVLGGLAGSDDGRVYSDPAYAGSDILLFSNDEVHVYLDNDANESGSFVIYANGDGSDAKASIDEAGNLALDGNCTGCAVAFLARNVDAAPLQPGDLVAPAGVAPHPGQARPLILVRRARPGDTPLGVVATHLLTKSDEDGDFTVSQAEAVPANDLLTVLVSGLAQVRVASAVAPGDRLALSGEGVLGAAALDLPAGAIVAQALEADEDGDGLVWVVLK